MSASAWDRAVEAAAEHLRVTHWDGNGCGTHGTSACSRCYGSSPADAREVSEEVLAAALPVLLEELTQRIEGGADGLVRTARQAVEEGNKGLARHASIKAEGVRCALGTVRGFAAEVTQ